MTRKILILYLAHFCLGCVGYFIKNTFKIHSSVDLNTMTRLKCIGTELTPIVQDKSGEQFDNDNSWKTKADQLVVPVHKENFTVRPELITFDATYTLIEPSQSIGRWYREALNIACDMQIRLPRPALFTAAFKKAYAYMDSNYPCFGALTGMTASAWWLEVVRRTYSTTEGLNQIEPDELEELLPTVFQMLYTEVFSTKAGWIIKEDVEYTLSKLKDWRDQGGGPKLAVVSNFDDRLPAILADLGISKYFDFVLTSFDQKSSKPSRGIFDEAVRRAGLGKSTACYHVGDSVENDVNGAIDAGWTALRIHTDFDEDFPDWFDTDTDSSAAEGAERRTRLMDWGRKNTETGREWTEIWGLDDVLYLFGFPEDPEKPIPTTYIRGYRDD